MAEKLKIMLKPKKLCAQCCPILIFWSVKWNYPSKNILKIQDRFFSLFRKKSIFLFSLDRLEREKWNFLRKENKSGPEFLICFSLGNSTSLAKKLGSGNIGHMDFWDITLF